MIKVEKNFPLKDFNTFGVDAKAKLFVACDNPNDLIDFLTEKPLQHQSMLLLGGGSNILFTKDFEGTVLHPQIKGIKCLEEDDETCLIRAGSGEDWDQFVEHCVNLDLGGIENLSAIPGQVGSAPVQNIGAYGVEAKDTIEWVEGIDLQTNQIKRLSKQACQFAYRDSIFKHQLKNQFIVTYVAFRLSKGKHQLMLDYGNVRNEAEKLGEVNIGSIRQTIKSIRDSKLPDVEEFGNAGSFFKNPVIANTLLNSIQKQYPNMPCYPVNDSSTKVPAGWLIDKAGLKGKREGQVGTHPDQALVIVNHGHATGKEIQLFSEKIQEIVNEKFGIQLEPEVLIL